jgi:hypothetical protein
MRRHTCYFTFLLAAIIPGTLGGCGGDKRDRQEVTGYITLKGQPLDDGLINFNPLDGQETGDSAQITNGSYQIPKAKGLSPGRYKVFIIGGDGRSGAGDASPDSPFAGQRPGKERVPPEYNENSKVIKEVKSGVPNKFDFDIP